MSLPVRPLHTLSHTLHVHHGSLTMSSDVTPRTSLPGGGARLSLERVWA
ncbi:hypothetical protein [Deinococcus sp.]